MEDIIAETYPTISDVTIKGAYSEGFADILSEDALIFLRSLHIKFNERRTKLLEDREIKQAQLDAGIMPDFLTETAHIRVSDWQVAPLPTDLLDRRVEITGPVDRKMVINALNSGAKVFMADFEDSNTPSWMNNIQGQINLRDAIQKTIDYTHPNTGKEYTLKDVTATLMVRTRGWHLNEKNILCHGEQMSGGLVDFGLFMFHNAKQLIENQSGPYFYLPKIENHLEARLWNDIFVFAQKYLGIPQCTIKATVLIETILAAFEIDEILFELKEHSAGLNCGRWDYIFSFIKKFRNKPGFVMPDRSEVTMQTHFMKSYSKLVVRTCHKRGVHAMGGMAAQIPIKNNPQANERAFDKVRTDKLSEVQNGHDGTWVAHPGLVRTALDIFNEHMPSLNQIQQLKAGTAITAEDLLKIPTGKITEKGLRMNIEVGIRYIESWLCGNGAAAINNLMEDAATAEISRTQIWQWIRNNASLDDGRTIDYNLYEAILKDEIQKIISLVGQEAYNQGRYKEAIDLFDQLVRADHFTEFLTQPAYNLIS